MNKKTAFFAIMLATLVFVIAAEMLSIEYVKKRIERTLIEEEGKKELVAVKGVAKNLDAEIAHVKAHLILASKIPEIADGDSESCNQKLDMVYEESKDIISAMSRTDENGIVNCATNRNLIGYDIVNEPPYMKEIIYGNHEIVLSNVTYGNVTKKYFVALRVPIFDENGTFRGTVGGSIYLNEIHGRYIRDIKFLKQGYVVLFDSNGDVLYHPNSTIIGGNFWYAEQQNITGASPELADIVRRATAGEEGIGRYMFEGKEKIAAYTSAEVLPGRRWTVLVTVPEEEITAQLNKGSGTTGLEPFILLTYMITGVVIFAFALIFWYLVKGVFEPISKLTGVIDKISTGEFNVRIDPKLREAHDEVGELAKAFERTIVSLRIAIKKINDFADKKKR